MTRKTDARLTDLERRIGPPEAVPIALTDAERDRGVTEILDAYEARCRHAGGPVEDPRAQRILELFELARERRDAIGGGIG